MIAICALSLPATAADFASSYTVDGKRAGGGGRYSGTVSISQTGSTTYQVVWFIAGQKFTGTGIGDPNGLAVTYRSGNQTGIAIYHQDENGDIDGYWTYAGGKQVYDEHWSPK